MSATMIVAVTPKTAKQFKRIITKKEIIKYSPAKDLRKFQKMFNIIFILI
jgi:hypothetical protein